MNIIKQIGLLLIVTVLFSNCSTDKSSDRFITGFEMQDYEQNKGVIDVTVNTITVDMDYSDNVNYKKLIPNITYSEGAKVSLTLSQYATDEFIDGVSNLEKSYKIKTDFTINRNYKVVATDGSEKSYTVIVNINSNDNFENVELDATQSVWIDKDNAGSFTSENVTLKGAYTSNSDWSGWNCSAQFSDDFNGGDEFTAYAKTDKKKFAILKSSGGFDTIKFKSELIIDSLSYCLSTKTAKAISDFNAGDVLKAEIRGLSSSNSTVFTLRPVFAINQENLVLDWKQIDMVKLGAVNAISIKMIAKDKDGNDLSIPMEICFDEINGKIVKK